MLTEPVHAVVDRTGQVLPPVGDPVTDPPGSTRHLCVGLLLRDRATLPGQDSGSVVRRGHHERVSRREGVRVVQHRERGAEDTAVPGVSQGTRPAQVDVDDRQHVRLQPMSRRDRLVHPTGAHSERRHPRAQRRDLCENAPARRVHVGTHTGQRLRAHLDDASHHTPTASAAS